jgi:hypothetical protein
MADTERKDTSRYMQSADLSGKWSMLVGEALRDRVAIGMVLNQTSLLEAGDDRLCIGCPDDFHLNELNMKKTRQYIQELAQKVYGAKMHLETIISTSRSKNPSERNSQTSGSALQQHPLVQTLIREFGAKPVNR